MTGDVMETGKWRNPSRNRLGDAYPIRVDRRAGPDEGGRFRVFVDGYVEFWTLDRIKAAVAGGRDVKWWVR